MNDQLPTLDTIIALVEKLYSSADPTDVVETQRHLQQLQKSSAGWELAHALLQASSLNCKYFGALTYTVNINLHGSELDEQAVVRIIGELLQHTVYTVLMGQPSASFLVRKLLSNLALMFINFFEVWKFPLASIAASLRHRSPQVIIVPDESNPHIAVSDEIDIVLLFSQILVEEAIRNEGVVSNAHKLFHTIHETVYPVTEPLLFHQETTPVASLECLNSWIQFVSTAEFNHQERYDMTAALDRLLDVVLVEDIAVSSRAIEVVIETLETKPSFFNKELKHKIESLIFSSWSVKYVGDAKAEEDYDLINNFSRLVTIFLEADVVNFTASILDENNDGKFEFLLSLTGFPAVPIDEELLSKDFLEFWSEVAEAFLEDEDRFMALFKENAVMYQTFCEKIRQLLKKLGVIYWEKIHIPKDDFSNYKTAFLSYRRDVADFFDLIYPIVGVSFYQHLIENVASNVSGTELNLTDVEASLYVLNSFSTNFSESNTDQQIVSSLSSLLGTPLLERLSSMADAEISTYVTNTAIQFLSGIDFFYKQDGGVQHLSSILNFLFSCVMNSDIARLAACRAVSKISDHCRTSLVEYLPNFENILLQMLSDPGVENVVRERITRSYASIVQGTKNPDIQGKSLDALLNLIQQRIDSFIAVDDTELVPQLEYLLSLLNCIIEIGKGLQTPDDVDEFYTEQETQMMNEYWARDPYGIHQTIISIIGKVCLNESHPVLLQNSEVIEKSCQVLKSGLTETVAGPFDLDSDTIVKFIVAKFPLSNQNSLPYLFQLLSSLVTANHQKLTPDIISEALQKILFRNLEVIKSDPDLMDSSISLLGTIIEKKPRLVLADENFSKILELCLEGIATKEKFIIRASSSFWTRLIVLRKGDKSDHEQVANLFVQENLGQVLTHSLITNFLQAARSNIEYYQDILKFLVAKYPLQVKIWLNQSFNEIASIRARENLRPIEKSDIFIKKILVTRGKGHQFNNVFKEFWLETNGLMNY